MSKTRQLVKSALFAALVAVATLIIKVPIAGTSGYVNLGDSMVLYSAYILGPVWGGLASAIGSAVADLILGYAIYAPATFLIKALVAVTASYLAKLFTRKYIISGIFAEVVMVLGYFIFEAVFLGYGLGASVSIFANCCQGIVAVIISSILIKIIPNKILD